MLLQGLKCYRRGIDDFQWECIFLSHIGCDIHIHSAKMQSLSLKKDIIRQINRQCRLLYFDLTADRDLCSVWFAVSSHDQAYRAVLAH